MLSSSLRLVKLSSKDKGYANKVYVNQKELEKLNLKQNDIVLINERICYQIASDSKLVTGTMACNGLALTALNTKIDSFATISSWKIALDQYKYGQIGTMKILLRTYAKQNKIRLKKSELDSEIIKRFNDQIFSPKQLFVFKYKYWWFNMKIVEINSVIEKAHDEEDILPSYDTIEGGMNDDNKQNEGDEILQFGKISKKQESKTKFDITLDENANMSWEEEEVAAASTSGDNDGSVENKWDIDISLDDQKENAAVIQSARFTINGQQQKYILC